MPPTCSYCYKDLEGEAADNPRIVDDEPLCDECYQEHHQEYCSLCEECFDKPTCAAEGFYYFAINNEIGLKPGIYQTLEWPFYSCDLFGDNLHVDQELLKQIRPLYDDSEPESGIICPECASGRGTFQEYQYADGRRGRDREYDDKGHLIRHDYFPQFALKKGDEFTIRNRKGKCLSRRFYKCIPYRKGEKTCLVLSFEDGHTERFVYDSWNNKSDWPHRYYPVKLLPRSPATT